MSGSALALLLLPLVGGLAALGITTLRRGRRLSLLRWGPDPGAAAAGPAAGPALDPVGGPAAETFDGPSLALVGGQVTGPARAVARPPAGRRLWMPIISRILLAACVLFWLLIVIGLAQETSKGGAGEAVLGAILITFIPTGIGVLLEVAYHRHRRPR